MPASSARALLGALLIDPMAVERVREVVDPSDLPTPEGRMLYEAILGVYEACGVVDFILVCDELEQRGTLSRVGTANLCVLINECPSSLHVEHYARLVAEAAANHRPALAPTLSDRLGLAG